MGHRQLLAAQPSGTAWDWDLQKQVKRQKKLGHKLLLHLTFPRLLRKGSVFSSVYNELFYSVFIARERVYYRERMRE